jgi:hypothetical protein
VGYDIQTVQALIYIVSVVGGALFACLIWGLQMRANVKQHAEQLKDLRGRMGVSELHHVESRVKISGIEAKLEYLAKSLDEIKDDVSQIKNFLLSESGHRRGDV